MWYVTKFGFYSVVLAKKDKGKGLDPQKVMVRARLLEHLQNLRENFRDELLGFEIFESTTTDYRFRMIVPFIVWQRVAGRLTNQISYGNFKNEVARFMGHCAYEHALHEVWGVMYSLQESTTGPGIYSRSKEWKDDGLRKMLQECADAHLIKGNMYERGSNLQGAREARAVGNLLHNILQFGEWTTVVP